MLVFQLRTLALRRITMVLGAASLVFCGLAAVPPSSTAKEKYTIAQIDPLRSDGAMLEEALKQVSVKVARKEYEGVTHEFFGAAAVLPAAKMAQAFAAEQLKEAFKE